MLIDRATADWKCASSELEVSTELRILKSFRMLRFLKLARLIKFDRILKSVSSHRGVLLSRLIEFVWMVGCALTTAELF